jgi:hypothetical protein
MLFTNQVGLPLGEQGCEQRNSFCAPDAIPECIATARMTKHMLMEKLKHGVVRTLSAVLPIRY